MVMAGIMGARASRQVTPVSSDSGRGNATKPTGGVRLRPNPQNLRLFAFCAKGTLQVSLVMGR